MVWAGSICFWNFNSMLVLGSICFAEFPRAKFRLPTALSIIWQNSTNVSTTTCVLVRRDYAQKRVNAKCSVFICRAKLFYVRWPNKIWWHIFQENVVKEDECQQLCGDQVTIFIASDPSPIIIALPCPSACPSLMLFFLIHWWLLSASDVIRAMLASLSNSLV